MESVAARDEIAIDTMCYAVFSISYIRVCSGKIMRLHVVSLIDGMRTASFTRIHQVARDFRLAVDHHPLAAGQSVEIDPMISTVESKIETIMRQPFGSHPCAGARLVQKLDGPFLKDPGSNAAEDIVLAHPIEDEIVYPCFGQKLAKQQARRSCAYDDDLMPQSRLPTKLIIANSMIGSCGERDALFF
ncbi:hypothetical protein D3C73_511530 [compost metagenome]